MDQAAAHQEVIMLGYGGLIHSQREKALLTEDGKYFDDDFDTWITPSGMQVVLNLEPYLFEHFKWSLRLFTLSDSVVLCQIMSICGHQIAYKSAKCKAAHPAIELYILEDVGNGYLRDNWQGWQYPSSWMFPANQSLPLAAPGYNHHPLSVPIPAQSEKVLDCIYGNWTVPSKSHAGPGRRCQ